MKYTGLCKPLLYVLLATALFQGTAAVAKDDNLSSGQTLYLPIYSFIWHGDRVVDKRYPLKTLVSALVSIRNTNFKTPLRLLSARYFNSNGKMLMQFVAAPVTIDPLATYELFVEKKESLGGSGANLIIQWEADTPVNSPIVEAIHAEIKGHSTFTFITKAQPINAEQ